MASFSRVAGAYQGSSVADLNPVRAIIQWFLLCDTHNSAALRDELIQEIVSLGSAEQAAHWARSALSAKNRLTAGDARLVQVAFEFRISAFAVDAGRGRVENGPGSSVKPAAATNPPNPRPPRSLPAPRCSRSAGARDERAPVASTRVCSPWPRSAAIGTRPISSSWPPCLVCGRNPADSHHLRFAQVKALGRKVSDEFTVPLCWLHHREAHRARNEAQWWSKLGIDALATALKLWEMTRLRHQADVQAHLLFGRFREQSGH